MRPSQRIVDIIVVLAVCLVFSSRLIAQDVLFSNVNVNQTFQDLNPTILYTVGGIDFSDFTGRDVHTGLIFDIGSRDAFLETVIAPVEISASPNDLTFSIYELDSNGLPGNLLESSTTNDVNAPDFYSWAFSGTTLLQADTQYAVAASALFENDGQEFLVDFGELFWAESPGQSSDRVISRDRDTPWRILPTSDFDFDPAIQIEGAFVVPEPSSTAISVCILAVMLSRRKRVV